MQNANLIVLGAGFAGLSTAFKALSYTSSIHIIHKGHPTSAVPGGLINYAAGRKANPVWRATTCYPKAMEMLEQLSEFNGKPLYTNEGVFRPALAEDLAEFFQKAPQHEMWSETNADSPWISWLDEQEADFYPYKLPYNGGLWLPKASTFHGQSLIDGWIKYLEHRGVTFTNVSDEEYSVDTENKVIQTSSESFSYNHLVVATGDHLPAWLNFDWARLHPVKGELMVIKTKKVVPHTFGISGLGYLSVLDDHTVAVGSTYEHNFQDLSATDDGRRRLWEKFDLITQGYFPDAQEDYMWAGIRASTPNRVPLAGTFNEIPDVYLNMGYGSKGLIYSAYVSELVCREIFNSESIPEEISVKRFDRFRDDNA